MLLATALNLANIIGRYVFGKPIVWAEEIMQLTNVWAVLLGAAVVSHHGSHITMDFFYNMLPVRGRRVLQGVFAALTVTIAVYVILQSGRMIGMLASTGQRSVIARLPMAALYLAVPLGYLLTICFLRLRPPGLAAPPPTSTTLVSATDAAPAGDPPPDAKRGLL